MTKTLESFLTDDEIKKMGYLQTKMKTASSEYEFNFYKKQIIDLLQDALKKAGHSIREESLPV